jgi:hypothetical protein
MRLRERSQLGEGIVVDLTTEFAKTAQQSFSSGAEGPVSQARVLFAGFALPSLQDPLQRIIDHPPVRVELRCEPI